MFAEKAARKSPGANKLCFCVLRYILFVSAVMRTQIEKPTCTFCRAKPIFSDNLGAWQLFTILFFELPVRFNQVET
jgi:hypothetical protein